MISTTRILFWILLVNESYGVIYYLNESEYDRMPPVFKLDDYNSCLQKPSDAYCSVTFRLVSDEPNELIHMIEEYSEHSPKHYNHSILKHGVCVTQKCQNYIQDKAVVSKSVLEGCLNQSLWESHKLKTEVEDFQCYSLSDHDIKKDAGDVIMGVIVFTIIVLNVIGSLYDIFYSSKNYDDKNILRMFSIKRNWKRLTSTTRSFDPRLQRLRGLNGLRCILMFGVIAVHVFIPHHLSAGNSHHVELVYNSLPHYVFINGPMLIQAFFVLTGFLLAYKLELYSEKQEMNFVLASKVIILRYFRLTPSYAVTLLLTATWLRFLGPGPLWEIACEMPISDCRRRWWLNLLYLNNYFYGAQCMLHGWYLAADMQLFCLSVIICVLLKNSRLRKIVLMTLLTVAIIMPAVHTYIRDLHPLLLYSPSAMINLLVTDPTFSETYQMGHNNVASFVIGLSLAYLVYRIQQSEIDVKKYEKLKYIHWTSVPLILALLMSGAIFYRDAPRDPLYIRVMYAAVAKPIAGMLIALLIAGMIFKVENKYRKTLEWRFWDIPSKLAYSVYLVHFPIIRFYIGLQTSLFYFSASNFIGLFFGIVIASFITALPLYLLVEAPFTELTKYVIFKLDNKEETLKVRFHEKIKNGEKVKSL